MLQRRGIVLRLIIAVLIIVILVIGAVGLVGSLLTRHFVHETARSVMRSNSDFLVDILRQSNMYHTNRGFCLCLFLIHTFLIQSTFWFATNIAWIPDESQEKRMGRVGCSR